MGTALPAFASILVCLLLGGLKDPFRARLQVLVWTAGLTFALFFRMDHPAFPPRDATEGLLYAALGLAVFVVISPHGTATRYMTRALFVLGLGLLVLWPIRDSLAGPVHFRNLAAFFFLGLGVWSIMERSVIKVQPPAFVALPLVAVLALFLVLRMKGAVHLADTALTLGVFLAGVLAVGLSAPQRLSTAAILPFVSVYVVLMMAAGHFYLHINPWLMIYLCVPYLVLWIRRWIPLVPGKAVAELVVLALISLIPIGYFVWTLHTGHGI